MKHDRFDLSFDHSDNTKPTAVRRVEVISGPERRRSWSDEEKLEIVAESLVEGVNVSALARRHGMSPQQLFGWRAKIRARMEAVAEPPLSTSSPALTFVPVVVADASATPLDRTTTPAASGVMTSGARSPSSIEIVLGTATIRLIGTVDGKTLTAVLRAVRAMAP
jgi:transposase